MRATLIPPLRRYLGLCLCGILSSAMWTAPRLSHAAGPGCVPGLSDAIAELLRSTPIATPSKIRQFGELALGRSLTEPEAQALLDAVHAGQPTAERELAALRLKGVFGEADLAHLRQYGVLGINQPVTESARAAVALRQVRLVEISGKRVAEVGSGKRTYNYFVDIDDQLHLTDQAVEAPEPGQVWVVKDEATGRSYLAKEAGELKLNKHTGRPSLDPSATSEMTPEETEALAARLKREHPEVDVERPQLPSQERLRVMNCGDVMAARAGSRNQLLGSLFTGNGFQIGGIVIADTVIDPMHHQKPRLESLHGRQVAGADTIRTNIGVFAGLLMASALSKMTDSIPVWSAAGGVLSYGLGYVGSGVRRAIVTPGTEDAPADAPDSDPILDWDKKYSIGKAIYSGPAEHFMRRKLPELIFEACLKGEPLTLAYNSSFLRVVDKSVTTLIYFGGRALATGQ